MTDRHPVPRLPLLAGVIVIFAAVRTVAAGPPDISGELETGKLAAAEEALAAHLAQEPKDDLARFQAGAVQFFAAVERLAQDSYRYGLNPNLRMVPFLRTPVKANPHPSPVTYNDVRAMIERFVESVEKAEKTLAPIADPQLAWELDLTAVRLDMNGDGQAEADENLWGIFQRFAVGTAAGAPPERFTIRLDSADVHWLRGYCHVLAALGEMILAYDHQRQFDHTAQLFFTNPRTPYSSILARDDEPQGPFDRNGVLDAIAFVHLANFPVKDPDRMTKARDHLLAMVAASRASWKLIEAETDNEQEWIPGPGQQSVVEGAAINQEQLAAWRRFLDEAEAVLNGEKLIPFWRQGTDKGINLMKVFTQPQNFDLVLWVQGTGAVPYLEQGEISSPDTWREFQRVFGGRFVGFAIWIN